MGSSLFVVQALVNQRRDPASRGRSRGSWECKRGGRVRYALAHMTQEEKKRLTDYADCAG